MSASKRPRLDDSSSFASLRMTTANPLTFPSDSRVAMSDHFDPSATDDDLVRAVRRGGSERAFGMLYDRHTPRAYQTAWRILGGSQTDAEDAMQEAWVRAIASLDTRRADAEFGAWLRGIAAHVAVDIVRRHQRLVFDNDVDIATDDTDDAMARLDLESAIASLPPGYRMVLVLHDIEGFTHEEIAERLGITAGTSKGQLFKARRAVRARLSPRIEETT
jgi:RNA polymerase sigma-70 factor, ECF subfamily